MAKVLVDKDFLEDGLELICDSIRLKTGGTGVLAFPVEIKQAVDSIETGSGGITPTGTKTITENGEGIDVTSFAAVDVAVPIPEAPSGTKQITENGTGIDVAQYAAVDVAVPTGITPNGKKEITANGDNIDVTNYASVKVAVPTGTDTSDATAAAGDIRTGKTAYVNGSKVTGSLVEKSAQTYTPTTVDQVISSGRILTGNQTIKGDAKLVPGNIKAGVDLFGVTGTCGGTSGEVRTTTSGSTATASTSKKMRVQTIGLTPDKTFGGLIIEGDSKTGPVFAMVLIRKSSSEWLANAWDVYDGSPRNYPFTPTVTVSATTSGIYKIYTVDIEIPSNGPVLSTASGNYGASPIWSE